MLQLAVLYHNENVNRPVLTYKTGPKKGEPQYTITRSKDTKLQPVAKTLRVPPTYGMKLLLQLVLIHNFACILIAAQINTIFSRMCNMKRGLSGE